MTKDSAPGSPGSPYTAADRARWKRSMLDKGRDISSKLEKILAGKDVSLEEVSLLKNDEPAETEEKRMRRYLDHVMERMRAVESADFGLDQATGKYLSVTELDERPWIDTSAAH